MNLDVLKVLEISPDPGWHKPGRYYEGQDSAWHRVKRTIALMVILRRLCLTEPAGKGWSKEKLKLRLKGC